MLCYHAVSPTWEADLSTTPARLQRQLALLARRGYRGLTFTEAVRAPADGRVVAITFDDAYRSVLEIARPILERFGFPATVFAPTDYIGSEQPMLWPGIDQWHGGPHEHELMPMSWEELRTLAASGWEIGSHTASHPHLTELDDEALAAELGSSKASCEEHMQTACPSLAYPYGDVDARVVQATRSCGYTVAAALPRRLDARGALEVPRIGVYHVDDDRRFGLKLSPTLRRLRSSAAWSSVGKLRSLAGRG